MQVEPSQIAAVRRFNRFHTRLIGALGESMLDGFSLAQGRLIYELARRPPETTASDLARALGMDPSYLSRLVAGFEAQGLVQRDPDDADGRRRSLRLTEAGRDVAAALDAGASAQVAELLAPLDAAERRSLVGAMDRIERLLGRRAEPPLVVLREPEAGDLGWVVERHAAFYARECGFDVTFEALVARIVADFAETRDPAAERGWIAEIDGERVGSVFVVRLDAETAKLRLLLVEPRRPRGWPRPPAGRGVPALRARPRLPPDDALDPVRTRGRPRRLRRRRLPRRLRSRRARLRPRPRHRDLGLRAVTGNHRLGA